MDFALPELGEGVYEAEFVQWKVSPGELVRHGQTLAEVVTDKATMDVPSPFQGTVQSLAIEPGDEVKVGQIILSYEPADGTSDAASADSSAATTAAASTGESGGATATTTSSAVKAGQAPAVVAKPDTNGGSRLPVRAAPSVRRMARSLGVDLHSVRGSGKGGRVLIEDLSKQLQAVAPTAAPASTGPDLDLGTAGTEWKLTGVRRLVADQMVQSSRNIPHYSYVDECDITEMVQLRNSLKAALQQRGTKLTYLAFFVQAVVRALREVPLVNATFDDETSMVTVHDQYHIGIATATEKGLVVPVLKHADQLGLEETAREIEQLATQVREHRARPEQLRGSTFTITSIGNIGGLISTPIINRPEVGIMGIGKVQRRPVYDEADNLRPADMLYLSFSFDHRIVDGAVGALFGNAVRKHLLQPATLLLR